MGRDAAEIPHTISSSVDRDKAIVRASDPRTEGGGAVPDDGADGGPPKSLGQKLLHVRDVAPPGAEFDGCAQSGSQPNGQRCTVTSIAATLSLRDWIALGRRLELSAQQGDIVRLMLTLPWNGNSNAAIALALGGGVSCQCGN